MCEIAIGYTYGVDKVELPGVVLEVVECNRVGVGVESESALNGNVHDHQTLGTQFVRQDLNRVGDQKTRPGQRVENTKEPNEEDHSVASARRIVLLVETAGQSPEDERSKHASRSRQEEWTTSNFVDEQSHGDGDEESQSSLTSR